MVCDLVAVVVNAMGKTCAEIRKGGVMWRGYAINLSDSLSASKRKKFRGSAPIQTASRWEQSRCAGRSFRLLWIALNIFLAGRRVAKRESRSAGRVRWRRKVVPSSPILPSLPGSTRLQRRGCRRLRQRSREAVNLKEDNSRSQEI